jgi:phosphoenolpyruvate---glycerone phosphotransferase subunit DhaM
MVAMSGANNQVSVILVSHSPQIAAGLAELLTQVAGDELVILTSGGAVDGSLGTNGGHVLDLIRRGATGGGAVVLADLGSSVLSVRAALSELSDEERLLVSVADAPFVEGAVAAAVAASTGCAHADAAKAAEEAHHLSKL